MARKTKAKGHLMNTNNVFLPSSFQNIGERREKYIILETNLNEKIFGNNLQWRPENQIIAQIK